MFRIGIDIGSTYAKYCIMNEDNSIECLFTEKTPVRQLEYFEAKLKELNSQYPSQAIYTCGYGRNNVFSDKQVNELIALAKGCEFMCPESRTILDIGGQDTKLICCENGKLNKFFVNDKCAAGSGMFLQNVCGLLEIGFEDIDLTNAEKPSVILSSVCAVFAQSEIVRLIAGNVSPEEIVRATIWQILVQSKSLLNKISASELFLSGGFTRIKGIGSYASEVFDRKCTVIPDGSYLAAAGCALMAGTNAK